MIKFLEKMWLMVGILTVLIAAYMLFTGATDDALYFLLFAVVAFILYLLRRKQRRGIEKNNA